MLHIMAASSAGAFRDPFPVYHADDEEFLKHAQRVKVRLVPPGKGEGSAEGLGPSVQTNRNPSVNASGPSMPLGLVQAV